MGTEKKSSTTGTAPADDRRIEWVDYAKGICIVLVVMMHSTLGVEHAVGREGWLHYVVEFAKPFRMPDFFLIAGLFLSRVIDRDWRNYIDRKVIHFAYFYLLWTAIQFAIKAPLFVQAHGALPTLWLYIESFWEPFSTLWFIYLLPIFFVSSKLAHELRIPVVVVWLAGAALELAPIATGSTVIDEFASRFVYFYSGYLLAPRIFGLARSVADHPEAALAFLVAWGLVNGLCVSHEVAHLPFVSLSLGLAGAAAVIMISVLLASSDVAKPLRYCGQQSIVIYLAFFLPMAASRAVLLKSGWITEIGTVAAAVTLAGVVGALLWFWAVRNTFLRFLFERPDRFWITLKKPPLLQPAE